MYERDVDPRLTEWLREGPMGAPAWVLEAVVDHARRHPHDGFRRGRWMAALPGLTLRPVAPVARVGVLLALVALALALGGIVYVGAQLLGDADVPVPTTAPAPAVLTCPAGSTPDQPGPADQARPEVLYSDAMAFDAGAGRIVLVDDHGRFWTFDVCENTWRQGPRSESRPPGWLVYDASAGLNVLASIYSGMWTYDLSSGRLVQVSHANSPQRRLAVYDPTAGSILSFTPGRNATHRFDTSSGTWTAVSQHGDLPASYTGELAAFDESVDRVVLYQIDNRFGARTYELDPRSGTWAEQDTLTPKLMFGYGDLVGHQVAYDAANARTVIFSNGQLAAYDAASHTWELLLNKACGSASDWLCSTAYKMTYDPVNQRVVVVGPSASEVRPAGGEVLAFDLATRTWLQLLAPNGP